MLYNIHRSRWDGPILGISSWLEQYLYCFEGKKFVVIEIVLMSCKPESAANRIIPMPCKSESVFSRIILRSKPVECAVASIIWGLRTPVVNDLWYNFKWGLGTILTASIEVTNENRANDQSSGQALTWVNWTASDVALIMSGRQRGRSWFWSTQKKGWILFLEIFNDYWRTWK